MYVYVCSCLATLLRICIILISGFTYIAAYKNILKEAQYHHSRTKRFIVMIVKKGKHLFLLCLLPFQDLIQARCLEFMKCYETFRNTHKYI